MLNLSLVEKNKAVAQTLRTRSYMSNLEMLLERAFARRNLPRNDRISFPGPKP